MTATQNKPSIASANSRPIPHSSHMEQWNKCHHKKKYIGLERHIAYSAFAAPGSSFMFHSFKVRIVLTYTHQGAIIYDENESHAVRRNHPPRPRPQSEQSQDDLDGQGACGRTQHQPQHCLPIGRPEGFPVFPDWSATAHQPRHVSRMAESERFVEAMPHLINT